MLPTLKPGHDILVLCWFYRLRVGELIALKKDGKEMIKRIQDIRDHKLFVTGDNAKESTDSRSFGWISKSEIIGKVIWC